MGVAFPGLDKRIYIGNVEQVCPAEPDGGKPLLAHCSHRSRRGDAVALAKLFGGQQAHTLVLNPGLKDAEDGNTKLVRHTPKRD